MNKVYIVSANPPYDPYVEFIQKQLNLLRSSLMPDIPYLDVDGRYGPKTYRAVRVFQALCGIRIDGIWGDECRAAFAQKIRERPIAVKKNTGRIVACSIAEMISKIASLFQTACDQALADVKNFARLKKIPKSGDIKNLSKFCFKNNSALNSITSEIEKLCLRKDAMLQMEEALKLLGASAAKKGCKVQPWRLSNKNIQLAKQAMFDRKASQLSTKINIAKRDIEAARKAIDRAFSRYAQRMQSQPFAKMIEKSSTTKPKVKGGGWLLLFSAIPIIIDTIAIFVCVCQGYPTAEWETKLHKDLCDFIEGIVVGIVITALVAAIGLTGWVAILVALALSIIVSVIYMIVNAITKRENHFLYDTVGEKLISMLSGSLDKAIAK